jgi:oxygen-independent coproporphyrinogen-3 oxidase
MAGIYLHIPFCKSICPYCDFHKTKLIPEFGDLVQAMLRELDMQNDYCNQETIESIYMGGGTPSVLPVEDLQQLLNKIKSIHPVSKNAEVTMELNPDDTNDGYIRSLYATGINRISIGCQSFSDNDLKFLKRRHTVKQALEAVKIARETGFDNISIDLIYGLQSQTLKSWENTIRKAMELEVQHISAYHLTIEPNTLFYEWLQNGKIKKASETRGIQQFEYLVNMATEQQYIHYEISNYALPGYLSIHNSNYWKQKPYLGIGPSAHSYNGLSRQWNIRDNQVYISGILRGTRYFEKEDLDVLTRYNEYVITALRTMWGIDLEFLENEFSKELSDYCLNLAQKFEKYGLLQIDNQHMKLTSQGMMVSDNIISDLLYIRHD